MFCQYLLPSLLFSLSQSYLDPLVCKIAKSLGPLTHGWSHESLIWNFRFSGENCIWKVLYNILKHKALVFLALGDTLRFENQSLEIRFFSVFSRSLNNVQCQLQHFVHISRQIGLFFISSITWLLKCYKMKCFTVRKGAIGSLDKSPRMFSCLLKPWFSCCYLEMKKPLINIPVTYIFLSSYL